MDVENIEDQASINESNNYSYLYTSILLIKMSKCVNGMTNTSIDSPVCIMLYPELTGSTGYKKNTGAFIVGPSSFFAESQWVLKLQGDNENISKDKVRSLISRAHLSPLVTVFASAHSLEARRGESFEFSYAK